MRRIPAPYLQLLVTLLAASFLFLAHSGLHCPPAGVAVDRKRTNATGEGSVESTESVQEVVDSMMVE